MGPLKPDEQDEVDAVGKQCRDALTPEEFARAWDEGAALDANAAADWALQLWARSKSARQVQGQRPSGNR